MNQQAIEEYISKLPFSEVFTDLPQAIKDRIVFGSNEMLKRRFDAELITDELIALQSLYVAEGEEEEFAKFRRQGVTNVSLDDVTLAVKGSAISPEVVAVVEKAQGGIDDSTAFFGRLL